VLQEALVAALPLFSAILWCCSVLQCVAVCCSVFVAVCCSVLQCVAVTISRLLEITGHMGWLPLVDSLKLFVSFAKEPYKRDYILQKRPVISRSLLIVQEALEASSLS